MQSSIKLPAGFQIGHAQNDNTGVTVVYCEGGAVGGVSVRGCAPGTRETDLLRPEKAIERVDAVVLTGGSAYGLESCCGVMRYLKEQGKGFSTGGQIVPLVAGAVLFDLNGKCDFPDLKMGAQACENMSETCVAGGSIGAGKGATVGKIRGPQFASKGGLGLYTVNVMGATVTAIVAVNAMGDVYDVDTGKIIAGALDNQGGFLNTADCVVSGNFQRLMTGANTTIGCIVTDAVLTKVQANKLASMGQDGLCRAIRPVHTDYDGDTLFTMSSNKVACDFTMLCVAAEEAVARAVNAAVRKA